MGSGLLTILFTLGISILSLLGALFLFLGWQTLNVLLMPLVAFSAGTLIGASFLHLLPESIDLAGPDFAIFLWLLGGYVSFLVLELILNWQHQHRLHGATPPKRPVTYMILIADSIHNLIDGLAIGGSFLISTEAGMITALAAATHEIPQELGDFGILVHGGWARGRALVANFLTSLTVIVGGLLAIVFARSIEISYLLPFAAGNFIYIAASDLIPEIQRRGSPTQRLPLIGSFLLGASVLLIVKFFFTE